MEDSRLSNRLTDSILGLNYGDEQERLRYFEAYAVMVHVQLIALPVIGATLIVGFGTHATAPVAALLVAVLASMLIGKIHLRRNHVRLELLALSRQNRKYLTAYLAAWLTLFGAVASRGLGHLDPAFAMGAAVGMATALFTISARVRKSRPPSGDTR